MGTVGPGLAQAHCPLQMMTITFFDKVLKVQM